MNKKKSRNMAHSREVISQFDMNSLVIATIVFIVAALFGR